MTKLYVSRYSNKNLSESNAVKVGISLGMPKFRLGYKLEGTIYGLAPSRAIFNLPKEDFIRAYRSQLDRMGVEKIRKILSSFRYGEADEMVLLCYEDITDTTKKNNWCHRSIFADWWYEKTGEKVEEYRDSNTYAEKERKKEEERTNDGQISGQLSLFSIWQ